MGQDQRVYDKEFTLNAVNLYHSRGRGDKHISTELGIPTSTLVHWVHDHEKNGQGSFPGKGYLKPSEAEYAQLRKELAVTRDREGSLKKSVGHLFRSPKMKHQFMQSHAQAFTVERMSKVFKVSRRGYYFFVSTQPSQRTSDNQWLLSKIVLIQLCFID